MNTLIKNILLVSLLSLTVITIPHRIISQPSHNCQSDCKDCCTGAQITVPQQVDNVTFSSPICEDQLDAATLLTLINGALEQGNILRLLQQQLYNRTNPISIRSLLDLPSLRPYYLDYCGFQAVVQPFYNSMDPVYVTKHSPFIDSYINLGDNALANEIDLILEDINNAGVLSSPISINIPQTLALFQTIRIQERRAGAMISVAKEYKDWNFSFRIPIYYLLHNFFLSDSEIERIRNAPFVALSGSLGNPGSNLSVTDLVYKNLVNDKAGLGDTRFMALYNIASGCKNDIWLGAIATLPTAWTVREGLIGGRFNKCEPIPAFDLLSIVNSHLCNRDYKITEMLETVGIAALRKLSILLVDVPLGNGRHFGVGPHLDIRHFHNDFLSTHTTIEAEFFSHKRKKRFFLEDKSLFNFNIDLDDDTQANNNLAFINEQILNTLFPVCSTVTVKPGWLFKARHELMLDFNCWQGQFGFDFWYQGAEHLGANFCGSKISFDTLNKGRRPRAYQGKVFGSVGHFHHGHHADWRVSLAFDDTVFNSGIGKDYTLSLAFEFYL